MRQILIDFGNALSDLGLELFLTGLLLASLFYAGWWLRGWSLQKQLVSSKLPNKNKADKVIITKSNYDANFWQGISTELFGAVITTFAFGIVLLVFQQYNMIQDRKADLIFQMGSPDSIFTTEAIRQLRVEGWIRDGTLANARLHEANLTNAALSGAYLTNADLYGANLTSANLAQANLTGTTLQLARLPDVNLPYANLTNVTLLSADLTNANLHSANLTEAILWFTNLRNADLREANLTNIHIDETTLLPDNTLWTTDTDMERFTDPNHPDFWDICINADVVPGYCSYPTP